MATTDYTYPANLFRKGAPKNNKDGSLRTTIKDILTGLNSPFFDDCCQVNPFPGFPTIYDPVEEESKYYDPEQKDWVVYTPGGGGGGGGDLNLQQVTDNGNTTDNNIFVNEPNGQIAIFGNIGQIYMGIVDDIPKLLVGKEGITWAEFQSNNMTSGRQIILQAPDKPTGEYTIATIDDITAIENVKWLDISDPSPINADISWVGNIIQIPGMSGSDVEILLDGSFPDGTKFEFIQRQDDQISFIATGGVTINGADGATKTRTKYSACTIMYNENLSCWYLIGDITT